MKPRRLGNWTSVSLWVPFKEPFEPFFVYVSSRPRGGMKNNFFSTIIVVVLWNKRTLKKKLNRVCLKCSWLQLLRDSGRGRARLFFVVRICHPNADSYRYMDPDKIFRQHEKAKKRQCANRGLEVEKALFTPTAVSARRAVLRWWGIIQDNLVLSNELLRYIGLRKEFLSWCLETLFGGQFTTSTQLINRE